jgi:CelD/BcsL family acetyltransferase involved in cellulose biosynthesis
MLLRFEVDGEWLGLLPIRRERRYYGRPIPHLGNWVHPNCFLGAPLVAQGMERDFWRVLLAWADAKPGLALFLHLSHFPLGSALDTGLRDVLAEQQRHEALVHHEERALLSSDLSPDDYWQEALNGKKRKELRRQHSRLAELGTLAVERRDDDVGIAVWTENFLALEAAGWKGRAGSALAARPSTAALFSDALAGAAPRGRLERLSLTLDGEPIAMLASFLTPPYGFSYKTCFDEAYARFSPGVLLQRENLAMLERDDIVACDSCAAADHPMIDHIWRERRAIGRLSIAIGGPLRRALFGALARAELARGLPAHD